MVDAGREFDHRPPATFSVLRPVEDAETDVVFQIPRPAVWDDTDAAAQLVPRADRDTDAAFELILSDANRDADETEEIFRHTDCDTEDADDSLRFADCDTEPAGKIFARFAIGEDDERDRTFLRIHPDADEGIDAPFLVLATPEAVDVVSGGNAYEGEEDDDDVDEPELDVEMRQEVAEDDDEERRDQSEEGELAVQFHCIPPGKEGCRRIIFVIILIFSKTKSRFNSR